MSTSRLVEAVEQAYLRARSARDRLDVARALGGPADTTDLERASAEAFAAVRRALDTLRDAHEGLSPEDRVAIRAIVSGIVAAQAYVLPGVTLPEVEEAPARAAARPAGPVAAVAAAAPDDLHERRRRLEAAYARASGELRFEGHPVARLQVLARLAQEPDEARRRALFLALEPLWRSVDGDGDDSSPYRALIARSAIRWRAGGSPLDVSARALGVSGGDIAAWAMTVLAGWRAAFVEPARRAGAPLLEPWDWWWSAGEAHRVLAEALPLDALLPVTRAAYASLGADLDRLNVVFDLHPRPGRPVVPVSYTTFGERPYRRPDGTWHPGRPTVVQTLIQGGLNELGELVHETGHAIHLAGIRTRPALADWPDSDALTEALGELVAMDVYDPAWQRRWLPGATHVDDATAVRARYAEIALDAAWTLFEIRLHESFERRPNDIWTEITSTWLGIVPHPEWSWWAIRGQLVEEPGYMANYAIGAVLATDLRAAIRAERGDWTDGDPGWYAWVREHVYRFGLERPAIEVVRGVLGRAPTADALLAQVSRAGTG